MKKHILIVSSFLFLVSCAQNKLNPSAKPQVETPTGEFPPKEGPGGTNPDSDEAFKKLESDVAYYRGRYQMPDVYKKITDNRGDNFTDLYGTRNMREVLAGVYYRGGANNKYHKKTPRDNMNPLPADGLMNLCQDGFSTALYFYDTNYHTAKPVNNCVLRTTGEAQTLNYNQISALTSKDLRPFMQMIHDRIKGKIKGPIYGHCWNGWHASGFMASATLKQFCNFTDAQAESYWIKNTDGNTAGYESVQRKVKNWVRFSDINITPEEKALVCPK